MKIRTAVFRLVNFLTGPAEGTKRARRKTNVSGVLKRWSKRWNWPERALALDAMLDAQRLAEVVKAVRKEGQKWAARWEEYRDRAWVRIKNQAESFAVFVVYRDLGPGRSMAEVRFRLEYPDSAGGRFGSIYERCASAHSALHWLLSAA